jgi:cation transport ATPase
VNAAGRGPWIAGLLLSLAPTAAHACAVCFGGEESDWTTAFVLGTVLMMALPPAIVLAAGIAIYRSTKRQERLDAE